MELESASERFNLAQRLESLKLNAAQAVTDEFFLAHPDWVARFGERGRRFCTEDACFHIEFLAGAVESGSPETFAEYARWTARMLGSRGIGAHHLDENFAQLEKHLCPLLVPAERAAVSGFLALGRQALTEPEHTPETEPQNSPLGLVKRAFLAAILGGRRQAALGIVEEAIRNGVGLVDIYVDVFSASLHSVGSLWEQNKISVAQEHMATAITQYAIAMIYPRLVPTTPSRGSMVVSGVSGEQHQIGANLVADAMEANGWEVRFLGTNLPHSTVLSTIDEVSADVLSISTTLVANLPSAADLIRSVRNKLGKQTPRIVLGGSAYRLTPHFARDVGGSEAVADLRHALAALCP